MGVPPRLRDHPDDLFALVGATSDDLGIAAAFVEKDFWVTELLRSVARPLEDDHVGPRSVEAIFKGGTSLSRVYRVIHRFSEDVDILVVCSGLGGGRRDRALKDICTRAGADLGVPEADCRLVESSTGIKRNVRYHYPRQYRSSDISEGVLLEMGIRGGPEPHGTHQVRSMVAEYAIGTVGDGPETWQEFAAVDVLVLGAERTLIEKLALLHGRVDELNKKADALARDGRHYYDICQLLRDPDVRARLEAHPGGTPALAADIEEHSQAAGFPSTPRPDTGYASSPAFAPGTRAGAEGRAAYATAQLLIWGSAPSFDDCLATIHQYADLL